MTTAAPPAGRALRLKHSKADCVCGLFC